MITEPSSMSRLLGVPPSRIPIGVSAFVSYILPPVVCYFVVALLAVMPNMRAARAALWPVVALLAFRAAVSVDISRGKHEREIFNVDLVLFMFAIATRTLDWALTKEPLVRHLRPANGSPSTIMDALDLASSFRGHGWGWTRGLHIPRARRPANRLAFMFCAFISAVAHAWVCGAFHRVVLSLAPAGTGSIPDGPSIFDETLPFVVRYLRASIITTCTALTIYASLQMSYDLCSILAILLFGQDPAQWPPVFDAPWCATSISDFWSRRWHQLFRRTFLFLGGHPLSLVFGRAGLVIGAFLSSAVFHHIAIMTLNSQVEMWRMLVGFGMMAPGVIAEQAFRQWTGKKVGGVVGWFWTMTWLLVWGNVIIEGFTRAGMFGYSSFIDNALPVQVLVEDSTSDFDAWLRAI